MTKKNRFQVTVGSTNVFADLRFLNPEHEQLKARLVLRNYRLIKPSCPLIRCILT